MTRQRFAHLLVLAVLAMACRGLAAALPPKYLDVPGFQKCLADYEAPGGGYRAWCLPARKTAACPAASWKQLRALRGEQALRPCPGPGADGARRQ